MRTGRFLSVEGGEGAGKSTQIAPLVAWLGERGVDVLRTREPGGSPGAEEIRNLLVTGEPGRWEPDTELLLHYAARTDHVARTIAPALRAGRWVVSDRFSDSTMAYQGFGHGLGRAYVQRIHDAVLGGLKPDVTLILDVPVELGLGRTRGRPGAEDRYERMGSDFHQRLRDGFAEIAQREPERCAVIDATQPIEAVQAAMRAALCARLPELAAAT